MNEKAGNSDNRGRRVLLLMLLLAALVALILLIMSQCKQAVMKEGTTLAGGLWFGVRTMPSGTGPSAGTDAMTFRVAHSPSPQAISEVQVNGMPTGQSGTLTRVIGAGTTNYAVYSFSLSGGSGNPVSGSFIVKRTQGQPSDYAGYADDGQRCGCFGRTQFQNDAPPVEPGTFDNAEIQPGWSGEQFTVASDLSVSNGNPATLAIDPPNNSYGPDPAGTLQIASSGGVTHGTYGGPCTAPNPPGQGCSILGLDKNFLVLVLNPASAEFPSSECPFYVLTK